ncbi:hypothetical protein C8Q76DRAFT_606051 [Earliella scabrosa]|nr:hypothetical protein C8Q76DRAFT_606051 [Earliella scabrosa]
MSALPPGTHHPSLPSSSSNSENNTPVPSGSAQKKPAAKRKRTGDSTDNGDAQPRTRDGPKKKKANRACFHCQKAHLTCDDSRPCQRCIKRGMADNCTEGHRKKAKYLLDEEELGKHPHDLFPDQQFISPDAMYPVYSSAGQYGVPAEAANLEYSILSAILGGSPDSGSSGSPAAGVAQPAAGPSYAPTQPSGLSNASWPAEPAAGHVYRNITKGYDYTEGYHFLMKHMSRRFDKNDILRIVRALAIVRPSLIALQMPMTEEDEVFVEKCFQRSLIELDKLVSFSGTPTVAWRRTGEICLVGPEFCMLTGWEREELVGRRKYIYELFENQSVVEYWENFANHAFENTTQSVYSHCVLLKPSGAPVPCTFCFSIRRDIMDLPSLVIGASLVSVLGWIFG